LDTPAHEPRANFYAQVYALVQHVPAGKVVTYGQVAALLGNPRAARAVGYALRFLPPGSSVPWHRVINHQGRISARYPAQGPVLQRLLLEAEGVQFDADDGIDLAHYRWHPDAGGPAEARQEQVKGQQ
jgi:methylated-DNA-protein-cysteine methyltransferase-like protein